MRGKNILITGSSSGIGECTARYLSSLGATIIMVARNEDKLRDIANELGERAYYFAYDLEDLDNIEKIFEFCHSKSLQLDGLVHAAGVCQVVPLRSCSLDVINKTMQVNALSFFQLCKYFCKKKYGCDNSSIVAISSIEVDLFDKGQSAYTASKVALESFAKTFAKENAKRKIRVNTIKPALVDTPFINVSTDNKEEEVATIQKLGLIPPLQIAYLIEFLLSERGKYITGASIPVSAGWNY